MPPTGPSDASRVIIFAAERTEPELQATPSLPSRSSTREVNLGDFEIFGHATAVPSPGLIGAVKDLRIEA